MRPDLYPELFRVEDNHWWHRHKRLVVHQLISQFAASTGKVIDIGAGTAKILAELKQTGWQATGVDSEPKAISLARRRGVKLILADLAKPLPFDADKFDLILCLDVLEHLENDQQMVREIKRVVKSDGLVIISVPAYPWLFSYWDKMLGHQRRYSKTTLNQLIKASGLTNRYLGFFGFFWLAPAILIRYLKSKSKQPKSDFLTTPLPWLTLPILKLLSTIESRLLKITKLPWGLSLLCVCRKA